MPMMSSRGHRMVNLALQKQGISKTVQNTVTAEEHRQPASSHHVNVGSQHVGLDDFEMLDVDAYLAPPQQISSKTDVNLAPLDPVFISTQPVVVEHVNMPDDILVGLLHEPVMMPEQHVIIMRNDADIPDALPQPKSPKTYINLEPVVSYEHPIHVEDDTPDVVNPKQTVVVENVYMPDDTPVGLPQEPVMMPEEHVTLNDADIPDALPQPKKRPRTEKEKRSQKMDKYPLLPPCSDKCRKSCHQQLPFTPVGRETINKRYWSLSFGERRMWLDGHIQVKDVKSRRVAEEKYTKTHTLIYHLPTENGSKVSVCKTMFLHTLGLKTDGTVTEFVKSKFDSQTSPMVDVNDKRGKAEPSNKSDTDQIHAHINSLHPQISHYTRERTPNRRYLDCNLSITDMWKDYNSKWPKVSYPVYWRAFEGENIGFGKPSQDDCDLCNANKGHIANHTAGNDRANCETCQKAEQHELSAERARHAYQADASVKCPDNTEIFAADMQRVILLPKMTTKEHLFVSRLVVFNETFASLTGTGDYVILWNEAIAGRLGINVASTYIKCINLSAMENIVFWADNCTGQNKNWALFTSLVMTVNQEWGPRKVTLKYFERGHTFMRADNVHGTIGNKMRKAAEIHNFQDFVYLCDKASKRTKPIVMHYNDFHDFQDGHRTRQNKNMQLPLLSSIAEVEFHKGSRSMFYKKAFDTDFTEVEFLKPKFDIQTFPGVMVEPRGISSVKKQTLLNLAKSFPPAKQKFWCDMPINDASHDLVANYD